MDSGTLTLEHLTSHAIHTLVSLLNDAEVPTQERAMIALKVLELEAAKPSSETLSLPPMALDAPEKFAQIEHFLPPALHQRILNMALKRKKAFTASTTTTQEADYRRSQVLYVNAFGDPSIYPALRAAILKALPGVLHQLDLLPFEVTEVEMQLTAHNDGNYYKLHNDSGSPETMTRELTYVYYFYREPVAFSGGELKLYPTTTIDALNPEDFELIQPHNNSIVFFPSGYLHEVLPVSCPSQAFEHSRFTLNGWLRK